MEQEQSHFEIMEQLGQISIFDVLPTQQEAEVSVAVGDKVRCIITEESDEMSYNYFHYYYPQVLKRTGEVMAIEGRVIHVRFGTDIVQLNAHEIEV